MTPEAGIKRQIREWLKAIGAYYFAPVQMGMGTQGVDIYACVKGRFVAIEVKVPGKRPTPRQMITLSDAERAGAVAMWVTSLLEVQQRLNAEGLVP